MRQITLSKLSLFDRCPGAAALPWVRELDVPGSALGSALHQVQEHRTRDGSADLDAIADRWELEGADRGRFFYLATKCRPEIPAGALAEVPLAFFVDRGAALTGAVDESHRYPDEGADLYGTIDVLWKEGDAEWVVDYKTGDENNVPPIRKNLQLRAAALLAARWTGAQRVIPAICFLDGPPEGVEIGQGRWIGWGNDEKPEACVPIGPAELDEIEAQVRDILHRVEGARLAVAAGEQPDLATGGHCAHCPARTACPAHLSEVREMFSPASEDILTMPITRREAAWVIERLPMIKRVIEKAEAAVKAHVDAHGPIALSDGKEYGAREETRAEIDPGKALPVLNQFLISGPVALSAFKISREGIKGAVETSNAIAERIGAPTRKVAPTVRAIMAEIKAAGGLTETKVKVYKARHPKAIDVPAPLILEDLGPLED